MDIKTEIKEEIPCSEVVLQTEREGFAQDVTIKLNSDASVCKKMYKTEIKEESVDFDFFSQNQGQCFADVPVMTVNPCKKGSEVDTKMEVKEELWWMETTSTEAPCVDDTTKDWLDQSISSAESIR